MTGVFVLGSVRGWATHANMASLKCDDDMRRVLWKGENQYLTVTCSFSCMMF